MYGKGFGEVVVQPLHITPGHEFHEKILANVTHFVGALEQVRGQHDQAKPSHQCSAQDLQTVLE